MGGIMKFRHLPIRGSVFILVLLSVALSAEQKTDAARPLNPEAGRVRALTPILTITDEDGSDYYFKRPSQPQFGPDGSIYVVDEKQILQFDPQGRFVRNYFKPGQGPGELNYVSGYSFAEDDLIILNFAPGKFVRFNSAGAFVSETPLASGGGPSSLIGCKAKDAFILKLSSPRLEEMKEAEGTMENKNPILALPLAGGQERQLGTFTTRIYYKTSTAGAGVGGGVSVPFGKYLLTPWGETRLAFSDDDEYAVKILDTDTGSIIQTLHRPYPRVETPPEDRDGISGGAMIDGKAVKRPAGKYTADIVHLLARGEELWVVTSTRLKGKGVLVDVYNREGVYTDSFYLPIPLWPDKHLTRPDPMALQGEFLLTLEKLEDGTYALRKYRLGK